MAQRKTDISKLGFEESLAKLEEIVEKLGSGKVSLEEMVSLYEEGIALKEHCSSKLNSAKMKVDVILKKDSD